MRVVITANGEGSRMKGLSPLPKHELYYKDKKIIDHLLEVFPYAEVLTGFPSKSRKETLMAVQDYKDCIIVDCDIIPPNNVLGGKNFDNDFIIAFISDKEKYSSIKSVSGILYESSETKNISPGKCSGIYFVKSVSELLSKMTDDNSIISGMNGCKVYQEIDSIIKIGDPSDYYEALEIHNDSFTGNSVQFHKDVVIKMCKTGFREDHWYTFADELNKPRVRYVDDEMIITERIYPTAKATAEDFIKVINILKNAVDDPKPFVSYLDNLPGYKELYLPEHEGTFFHGDLSTHNVLKNSRVWLIDPNYKNVFGSWLTDAGKAVFSFIAYEQDYPSAKKIADAFCPEVWNFAVAEGLRVTKYKPEYLSIVNNIYEICLLHGLKRPKMTGSSVA